MGCDIHAYREKLVRGQWLSADRWVPSDTDDDEPPSRHVPYDERIYTGRNYQLFGILSRGVRSEHPFSFEPRGIPFDVSAPVRDEIEGWGCDGHSHSYLYLHELRSLRQALDTIKMKITGMKDSGELDDLQKSIDSSTPDWNKLFPYCQGTNNPSYRDFEIDVPASFYVGADIDKIIAGFDLVDGENHRLVFFFDN